MRTLALLVYLLVWWQVAVALEPVLYALDDWAMGRRAVFLKVSLHYLPRYIDEFCYRHNNRGQANIFELTIARGVGVL